MRCLLSLCFLLFVVACPESGPVVVDQEPDNSVGPCTTDTDCGLGNCVFRVFVPPICVPVALEGNECTDRNDCDPGMVCIDSECVSPPDRCTSSEECPAGTLCDAFSGECIDPNGATNTGDGGNADGNTTGSGDGAIDGSDYDGGSADGSSDGSTDGSADGSTTGGTTTDVTATETCLSAPLLTGNSGSVQGNYGLLNDYVTDYNLTNNWNSGCTGSSTASGREVVYSVEIPANKQLTVTVNAECASCDQSEVKIDEVIYLLNTCPADGTSFDGSLDNCVAGAQDNYGGPDNPTETFNYTNTGTSTATYYIVVDAWCADLSWFYCPTSADGFVLEWTIQ